MKYTKSEAIMEPLGAHLFAYELQALLDALRRDLRMEISRSQTDPEWATYHNTNARLNMRLLELLEPGSSLNKALTGLGS